MRGYTYRVYGTENTSKVVFFFPAGFTSMRWYRLTIKQLNRMGYTVVGFDLDWKNLVYNLDLDGMIGIVKSVNDTVRKLKRERFSHYKKFAVFGTSFGTLLATYIAKQDTDIDSVVLNMPYGKFSHLIWTYKPAETFKQKMIDAGIDTEEKLHQLLLVIEPQQDLDRLTGKNIANFTAMSDKIVFDGKEFETALKHAVPTALLFRTKYGHFWGGIENILNKKKWSKAL